MNSLDFKVFLERDEDLITVGILCAVLLSKAAIHREKRSKKP